MTNTPDEGLEAAALPSERKATRRAFLLGAGAAIGAASTAGPAFSSVNALMAAREKARERAGGSGGTLRVGVSGGGQAETLNPILDINDTASTLRGYQVFEWLAVAGPNTEPVLQLAESLEPNATGTEWTARLRAGVEWHDGKPLTADDLIYTLRYISTPKVGASASSITSLMNIPALKRLDSRTVRIPMLQPIGDLPSLIVAPGWAIIQDGTTSFDKPIGTGPFKFQSWVRGQSSSYVRNPNYWVSGEPHVDGLEVLSIDDDTARLNALLGGQVDAIGTVSFPDAKSYQAQGSQSPIAILLAESPQSTSFTMGTAHAPFNDVRVRQAFRLIVNRPQMIENAQFGFGKVANDLPMPGEPYYDSSLPQREQDIAQAKALLKQAGHESLSVVLNSTNGNFFPGQLAAATLFKQQAQAAGVTVSVNNIPAGSYYSTGFPNYTFAQIQWTPSTVPSQYLEEYLPTAPLNGCQWRNPTTTKLIHEALRTVNRARATELWAEVQKFFWNEGPEIYWGTCPIIDAASPQVKGATVSRAGTLNNYDFRRWSLA
jgi:peptide/nickel transport system substrate-binding protein